MHDRCVYRAKSAVIHQLCIFKSFRTFEVIFFLFKVGSSRNEGDLHSARQFSKWAKYLSIASIIVGIILIVVVIVLVQAGSVSVNSRKNTT